MLAKLALSAVLVAGTFCANAFGQQTQFERPGVTQTAYTFQDKSADGDDNAQLKSELERMKLRLRELEFDVEKKKILSE